MIKTDMTGHEDATDKLITIQDHHNTKNRKRPTYQVQIIHHIAHLARISSRQSQV